MTLTTAHAITFTAAYLTGAIPFGFLVSAMKGVDIRKVGSGNIGATNVFRCVGKGWGILVFALDMTKGFVAVKILPALAATYLGLPDPDAPWLSVTCALLAVAGHNWTVFLKFKGGKGIATTTGVLLGLAPGAVLAGLVAWLAVFLTSRYVSLASVVACALVPAYAWIVKVRTRSDALLIPITLTVLGLMGILRHRANIQRLLKGTENRFQFKKRGEPQRDRP